MHVDGYISNFPHENTYALASSLVTNKLGKMVAILVKLLGERALSGDGKGKRDYTPMTCSACNNAICGCDGVMINAHLWSTCGIVFAVREASDEAKSKYKRSCYYIWKVDCCSKNFALIISPSHESL